MFTVTVNQSNETNKGMVDGGGLVVSQINKFRVSFSINPCIGFLAKTLLLFAIGLVGVKFCRMLIPDRELYRE